MMFLIYGCAPYTLLMTSTIEKTENINVLIAPFKDMTGAYQKEYQIEKKIADALNKEFIEFKGMYINPYSRTEAPRYDKNFKNPYSPIIFLTSDSISTSDELNRYISKNDIDIVFKGTIEMMNYGISETIKTFGSGDLVQGNVAITVEAIDVKNDLTIRKRAFQANSKFKRIEEISREKAINQAMESIVDEIFHIFMMRK